DSSKQRCEEIDDRRRERAVEKRLSVAEVDEAFGSNAEEAEGEPDQEIDIGRPAFEAEFQFEGEELPEEGHRFGLRWCGLWSQGLKPDWCGGSNVRAKARTYLRNRNRNRNKSNGKSKSKSNGRSRSPAGMTTRKATARTKTEADPYGMTNKKSKNNGRAAAS